MAIASVPNVVVGGATKASDHNALVTAVNAAVAAMVPVGTIVGWHKTLSGVPALPGRWVECDGSVISDADSPMDGETLPDLNGDARFLRGAATSGAEEADAFQGHWHKVYAGTGDPGTYVTLLYSSQAGAAGNGDQVLGTATTGQEVREFRAVDAHPDTSSGTPRTATETRPINMSVVWIMRIK